MAERRSMNEALRLTEEERAFIHGEETSTSAKRETAGEKDDTEPEEIPTRPSRPPSKPRKRATPPKDNDRLASSLDDGSLGDLLVPVTTRLSLDTANALRRTCLERRLGRIRPCTQQQIIEAAVRTWLAENRCSA